MELLERENCLAELVEWLTAVPVRGGSIALLRGEAGVGKTSLLQEFAGRQRGVRVLWGACDALFTPRPLAPLHDVARQTTGALLAAVSAGADRDTVFATVLDELETTATLLVLDDMHWADEATLDLLKYLGRRIHRTRALVAVTYRDDEIGPRHPLRFVIGDLPRTSTHRMSLSPLSEPAVARLAERAGRSSNGLHSLTGGNPFFVTEVLAAAADAVPITVRDAVLSRAVRLPPAAREVAELISVVPGRTECWLLERAGLADETAIEDCLRIGMLRDEDGALAFRHELARRAYQDSLPQAQQRKLHARVLSILALRPGVSAARLAHHADGARRAEDVLRFAPAAAAQAASVGAHREAASHYHVALRYAQDLPACERGRLQEQLSYECYLTGQHVRAIEAQLAALEIWRSSELRVREGDTLRWLSRLSWFAGDRGEADRYGTEAVRLLESLPPGPELARAYCDRAALDMEAHAQESAIQWTRRAIGLAERWGSIEILGDALQIRGTVRLIAGDAAGWADLERSLQLALAGGFQELVADVYTNMVAMAVSRRQYAEAARHLSAGLAYCEQHDLDFTRPYLLAYSARMKFECGDWNGSSTDIEAVLRDPRSTPVTRIPALRTLAHLRIRRGDPDASGPLEAARALAGPTPELQRIGTLAAVCAEAAWLAGDRPGVLRAVQPAYELARRRRDPRMHGELASWLWRVGALQQPPTDVAEPYALEIAGDWQGAARVWNALDCPYEYASLLGWHGTEPEQREALAILERLGAEPAAQALRRRMRAKGVRGVARGARISTRANRHGLTRREAETLALLSEGLRNSQIAKRLFVSVKTVDHHVSAILTKLGVASRALAVAKMAKQPDLRM